MKIIEAIREYISKLDCMKVFDNAINVNYLDSETDSFSIEEVPSQSIIKKYVDGSSIRQFQFTFCSREPYGSEVIQNIDNRISIFYSLEDAVNASYNVRKLLGIRDFEVVLKKLYDKEKLYEMYGIDESCDKHLSGSNSDVKVKKVGKRI